MSSQSKSLIAEIITVEGLDGVGKSTTVEALVAITNGVDVTRALAAELDRSRDAVMRAESAQARCHYWLAVNYMAGERAAACIASGRAAVIDSYFFRTIVSHTVLGVRLDWTAVVAAAVRPDRAVLLTVAEEVRRSRLAARGEADAKPRWHHELGAQPEPVMHCYRRFGLLEVDTSAASPTSVAAKVLSDDRARQFDWAPP
jgi:thymidylate kinase